MAYATIVFASLFYILRTKGFGASSSSTCGQPIHYGKPPSPEDPIPTGSTTSSRASSPARGHHTIGNQPPSPPPEPGSSGSTDKAPCRSRWLFWLLLIVALRLAGSYAYFTNQNSLAHLVVVVSPWIQHLSVLESDFFGWCHAIVSWSSTVKLHLFLHGLHYCQILLLALASHSGCISIHRRLSRLRSFIAKTDFHHLLPFWVFYAIYTYFSVGVLMYFPNRLSLMDGLYSLGRLLSLTERSVILGPSILHFAILFVWTMIRGVMGVPSFTRALQRQVICLHHRRFLVIYVLECLDCVMETTVYCLPFLYWRTCVEAENPALQCLGSRWRCVAGEMWLKYKNMGPIYIELGRTFIFGTAKAVFDAFRHVLWPSLHHSSRPQASGVNPKLAASLNLSYSFACMP
ncbi:hypothetical protein FB451DRAFT_1364855, partial [Mycena latifolia]